jgi:hypothetical protein
MSWPCADERGRAEVCSLSCGRLTLNDDVTAAFDPRSAATAPAVVVAVGAAAGPELRDLLERIFAGRAIGALSRPEPAPVTEGGLERRLGTAGTDATLRLTVPLPPPDEWRRGAVEVLWEILPELLAREIAGIRSRSDERGAILEARVDASLAELRLRALRLALARVAQDPGLVGEDVTAARLRLEIRRQAALEQHPEGAEILLRHYMKGGREAVLQYLFGLSMVDVEVVRRAAREWLGQHPGSAVLMLPPHVLNPRFAPAPRVLQLGNDLSVAVLERPGAALASISLRPVLLPDLDGGLSATILTRLSTELRGAEGAPGWIRVTTAPAAIELAVAPHAFAELCEVLVGALDRIAADPIPLSPGDGSARRRALQLLAGVLGTDPEATPSPAILLQPDNLALGAVVADGEAAVEALHKIVGSWSVERREVETTVIAASQRTRAAVPGTVSVLAVALPLAAESGMVVAVMTAELWQRRARQLLPETEVEVLLPFIPGRAAVIGVLSQAGELDALEAAVGQAWPELTAAPAESELEALRRTVAARLTATASGSLGRARVCAAVAAGAASWRSPTEVELEVLTTDREVLEGALRGWSQRTDLDWVGAGVLPLDSAGD